MSTNLSQFFNIERVPQIYGDFTLDPQLFYNGYDLIAP